MAEKFKCPKCGGTEFLATQHVSGSVDVIATIDVGSRQGTFLRNPTEDGLMDTTDLECKEPEGPFTCANKDCGYVPLGKDFS